MLLVLIINFQRNFNRARAFDLGAGADAHRGTALVTGASRGIGRASALKAASQLQLQVLASNDPKIADIAARLPVGRVHATGRTFVPFIRRDLYDQLLAAAANGNLHQPPAPLANGTSGNDAGSRPPASSAPKLPRTWQEIGVGDLVVAQESLEDGWYEAIVVDANGDMFSLRWRDYPRQRQFVRHRLRLGLLYPEPKTSKETGRSLKASTPARRDQTIANTSTQAFPKDWREIDVNHLVLAKDDSQWSAWWEAIPVEKAGDLFKLRWRNNPTNAPPITRSRYELALICADAA
jgi:NAD(P)-dependent dehydrogenase (short-subunit alcohol dehydrogenase family)